MVQLLHCPIATTLSICCAGIHRLTQVSKSSSVAQVGAASTSLWDHPHGILLRCYIAARGPVSVTNEHARSYQPLFASLGVDPSSCSLDIRPFRYVEPVQELHGRHVSMGLHLSRCESRTFRISLFLTRQICWMSAALCDTFSREFPVMVNSSFWFFEISTSTPSCIVTRRTIFSPKKFL